MRKILPYLLLNFAVSALAVWVVLMIWEANHKLPEQQAGAPLFTSQPQVFPTLTPLPLDAKTIQIQLVVGMGDIRNERVQLVNASESPLNLLGWELTDNEKHSYTFPSVTLFPGAAIDVYTKGGVNTAVELYWNLAEPIFASGDDIRLKDAGGNTRAEYQVP
ncbi:MAG TPA: lamin tail domain-containing protein [Anaerolineaceae bacterium]|nr:lamin tail domain-containing protein [Anaerolineaceae bacterium]